MSLPTLAVFGRDIRAAVAFLLLFLDRPAPHAGDIVVEIIARHGGVFHYAAVEVDDELATGTVIGTIELEVERES